MDYRHRTDDKWIQSCNWKSQTKSLLGRPRYRLEDDIRVESRGIDCKSVNWIHVT